MSLHKAMASTKIRNETSRCKGAQNISYCFLRDATVYAREQWLQAYPRLIARCASHKSGGTLWVPGQFFLSSICRALLTGQQTGPVRLGRVFLAIFVEAVSADELFCALS